ncbi:N-acetylglucosaminyl deacetylase, LmbE family [Flavobacterium fluvii]|uniref:N-acetylglucosaminyl deacetylase, LmbE family n=1 Tax=Flavobacterium fluvii TaxID=468056 RepID=A0A1M5N7C6_9FLAO|nr:PIG-L family deacetylase [Flavobacterium fluvii]SHG85506.1 N-acetylglucosaminyl deacetylase, LmbE family [Flavobacterium fluvii]
MQKVLISSLVIFLLSFQTINAQQPQKPNSVEIYNQIQKLNFLGSVLYIAAHPDDENTRLISYLSNETKARTGYLSLTRGDGGQNLIGPQLRELLGVIRTQELIEARKIDGGEQFFTRANDFGFSKNPSETLDIWDKEKVLSDIIFTIRKFQPDVIINRFDHRSSGNTHGHHSASAMLSVESFAKANDPTLFPEQLKLVEPWQTKLQFFNPSWWFYGSKEKFAAADKSNFVTMETGVYYPSLGKSNQEIAALSRSCHQSQGFGTTAVRYKETEYLEQINGDVLKDKTSIFEGIDTSWNRVKGGKPIGELMTKIISEFDFKNPPASIPDLVKAYSMMQVLDENHWKQIKSEEIKNTIAACAGLYLEARANIQEITPESRLLINVEAINRSPMTMQLTSLTVLPNQKVIPQNLALKNNVLQNIPLDLQLPSTIEYTQPYWLKDKGTEGIYAVADQKNIGIPDIIREVKVVFNVQINGVEIPFERTVIYKYNDKVKGEVYNYLDIVPEVTTSILDKVSLFKTTKKKYIAVKIKAGKDAVKGDLQLELPKSWIVLPKSIPFNLDRKGMEQTVYFEVTPPKLQEEAVAKSIAIIDGKRYDKEQIIIDFSHITKQQVLQSAEAKFIRLDLKTEERKIAYIMGAGDDVPNSLRQMGYKVTLLDPEEISPEKLESFDVVMTGIRAFNTVEALVNKLNILYDFVKSGKTMIVQYNTPDLVFSITPFSMNISQDRVTDENAEVRFLAPNHPVLNSPNTITAKDFQGWKQEQGLYYPDSFDKDFTPILSSNDKGESPKKGALLIAPYGKGHYIYTGLSFFRELPEGVSGAYKLLANMISLQTPVTIPSEKGKL